MGIFNFKEFITERLGAAEASLIYVDILQRKTFYKFSKFLESSDNNLDETVEVKYRSLTPFIKNKELYKQFPVVGFELVLEFKKMTSSKFKSIYDYPDHVAVGGYASTFGNKNWKHYSKIVKPMKRVTEHGLIIQLSVGVDIDKINFDIENPSNKKELMDGIISTLYHELNHCYEHYKRTIKAPKRGEYKKPIYDRSFNTALTYAENNIWKFPKSIWYKWTSEFLNYIYISESQELNANIQEIHYFINKYPEKELKDFKIFRVAKEMENFDADSFYTSLINQISAHYNWKDMGNALLDNESEDAVANKLKYMWVSLYEKEVKGQKGKPIISIETFKKMNCKEFIKFWGKKFNENGKYLIKKIIKIKGDLQNEKIQ
jgi:hypothetical protein